MYRSQWRHCLLRGRGCPLRRKSSLGKRPLPVRYPPVPSTFFSLATRYGILLHVQQNRETGQDLSHRNKASYLHCCVISELWLLTIDQDMTRRELENFELVAMLLKGGGDPNTVALDGTRWCKFQDGSTIIMKVFASDGVNIRCKRSLDQGC